MTAQHRIARLAVFFLLALCNMASTPVPPPFPQAVQPTGWNTVITGGFDDSRNICASDMIHHGGVYWLGMRWSSESAQYANAALLRSSDGLTWESATAQGSGVQALNHTFIAEGDRVYDLPGFWRGGQTLLRLEPEGTPQAHQPFDSGLHLAFAKTIFGRKVLGFNAAGGISVWAGDSMENLKEVYNSIPRTMMAFSPGQDGVHIINGTGYIGLAGPQSGLMSTTDGETWSFTAFDPPGMTIVRVLAAFQDQLFITASAEGPARPEGAALYSFGADGVLLPLNLPDELLGGGTYQSVEALSHADKLYLVLNAHQDSVVVHQYGHQTAAPVILQTMDGRTWQRLTMPDPDAALLHDAALDSLGGTLFLRTSDIQGNDRIWRNAEGEQWQQLYGQKNLSTGLTDTRLYLLNGSLYYAICDRSAGVTLLQYTLERPADVLAPPATAVTVPAGAAIGFESGLGAFRTAGLVVLIGLILAMSVIAALITKKSNLK